MFELVLARSFAPIDPSASLVTICSVGLTGSIILAAFFSPVSLLTPTFFSLELPGVSPLLTSLNAELNTLRSREPILPK